jgi:peptidoglycan/xylan/chitin deacetylase (PgdA/CDA1 family)
MRGLVDGLHRRMTRARPRPVILMYHRVAEPQVDPWGLAVRPDRFGEHLAVLRRSRHPLPMSQFVARLEGGVLCDDAVAITFDDGYADNLREARPRLDAADLPATVFVTTGAVGQRTEYWWDELARGILLRRAALDAETIIAGEPWRLTLPPAESRTQDRAWRAWEEPRSERQATYMAVWRRLRTVPAGEREQAMTRLRGLLELPPPASADLPMTQTEIADLAADDRFEIGGHTVTHPVLPALEPAERRREILQGKTACERLTGRAIAGFAYPHGAFDDDSRAAVEECGFAWACSTESRAVTGREYDRYALPRIAVTDSDGDAFARALRGVTS